jgi:hypothetical protein
MNPTNRNAAAEARGVPETDQLGGKANRENSLTTGSMQGQRGGDRSRAKGDRIEREIVSRHAAIEIKAERYPLGGGSRFRGSSHDVDIYPLDTDEGPLVAERKSRRPDGASLLRWHDEVVTASGTRHDPGHSRVVA